jgi:homoserine dehydrogenase
LKEAMRQGGTRLAYSGTTGVSPPDDISNDRALEIRGILNGTTNYILSEMQGRSVSFDEALAAAQSEGIAEPDPSLDIEGWDTASKILILAKELMGADSTISQVSRIGIGHETESLIAAARERNARVRLIGRARIWQGRVRVSVAPKMVTADSPFYSISGTSKAALFRTEMKGEVLSLARSGRDAISRVILDDLAKMI